jgi:antitoxin FitA
MNKHIQIRNVDAALHRKLKIRAAERDMSLSDYLKREMLSLASKPTLAEMAERLKKLPPVNISTDDIVNAIREDRDSR